MSRCCILLYLLVSVTGCVAQSLPVELSATVNLTNGVCASTHLSMQEQVGNLLRDGVILVLNSRPPCACGGPGEWTRIAHLNMSDTSQQCPVNWNLITTPVRGCDRSETNGGCNSAFFPANSRSYSRVCGRVVAYQKGATDAFHGSYIHNYNLEFAYLDGVSLTHGAAGSRQHIWSFASALYETHPDYNIDWVCPCINIGVNWTHQIPSFVGNNYFCDTGNTGPDFYATHVHHDDPLWDGAGCGPTNACCTFNNPPWFCTALPQPTTDDLEVRLCHNEAVINEDNVVSLIDVYVQ